MPSYIIDKKKKSEVNKYYIPMNFIFLFVLTKRKGEAFETTLHSKLVDQIIV